MEKKTVVLIGGGLMQLPVIHLAHQQDIDVVCLDGNSEALGRQVADYFYAVDIKDKDACLAAVMAHKKHFPVNGVLTVGTDFSTTVAWIAQALDLPGHSYDAALKAKDKSLMRQCFLENGVPSPAFKVFEGKKSIPENEGSAELGFSYPMVVKPADNMGARGVVLVKNFQELKRALEEAFQYSPKGTVLAEEYLEGPEFSLDSIIHEGKLYPMGLADRHIYFPPYFVELGHSFPSSADVKIQEGLWDLMKQGAKAMGLTEGAVKGDLKWTSKGPMVVEMAARLSGGYMSGWTYPYASGQSAILWALDIALGKPLTPQEPAQIQAVVERAFFTIPGRIKKIINQEKVRLIPGVKDIFSSAHEESDTVWPRNNVEKTGNVICTASTLNEAKEIARQARLSLVYFLYAPEEKTEAFFKDSQSPWWFEQGRDKKLSADTCLEWKDSFDITVKEYWDRLIKLDSWFERKDSDFLFYLIKGGPSGAIYFRDKTRSGD